MKHLLKNTLILQFVPIRTTKSLEKKNILIFIDNAVDLSKQRLKFDIRSNLFGSVNIFLREKSSFLKE